MDTREAFEKLHRKEHLEKNLNGEYIDYDIAVDWYGFERGYQSAEAKYLPVIEKLVRKLEEAIGQFDGGHMVSALISVEQALALAAPLLKE